LAIIFPEDRMHIHKKLIAFSILAMAAFAAAPARASVKFTTARFEITFPNGWQALTSPGAGDSLLAVFSQTTMAFSWMTVSTTDHPLTAEELEALRQTYTGSDSVTKVADGTKALGGKSFTYVEYEVVDTADGNGRVRIYYTSSGTQLFTGLLSYDPAVGTAAVTELETALGTLTLTGTPIRALARRSSRSLIPADHDILGRASALSARTWLFRLPAR
jgi:hypothetical protein